MKPLSANEEAQLDDACAQAEATVQELRSASRSRPFVKKRQAVARILHRAGWTIARIADAIGRERTTVENYLPWRGPR